MPSSSQGGESCKETVMGSEVTSFSQSPMFTLGSSFAKEVVNVGVVSDEKDEVDFDGEKYEGSVLSE